MALEEVRDKMDKLGRTRFTAKSVHGRILANQSQDGIDTRYE